MKEGKIKIFQADDNDQCDNGINKFFIVIKILLSYLNINEKKFEKQTIQNKTLFDYNLAIKEINKSFYYKTSTDKLTAKNNNLEDVKEIFTSEIFDIYIIDLNWGKNIDGGLELLKIIENRVPTENIIIFSNYGEIVAENYSSEKHSRQLNTVLTKNIQKLLPKHLSLSLRKIREKIINECSPRDKKEMKNAISYNSYQFFAGKINHNNSSFTFKNLYLDQPNIKCEDIAKDVAEILKTNFVDIEFVKSSLMYQILDSYLYEFNVKESKEINELLDFASVNYFLQIFFNLSKKENISIRKDKFLKFHNPQSKKVNGWISFYKLLILRRVIILWSKNHSLLQIQNDEPFYQFSQLVYYGKVSNEKDLTNKMEFDLIGRKAGFFTPYHDLTINNNLLFGEIEMIEKYSKNKLENIIESLKEINKKISLSRYGTQNECFDFWDIKSLKKWNNFIQKEDFVKYNYDINEIFNNNVKIDKEFKKYIFSDDVDDFNQLITKIIKNNLK